MTSGTLFILSAPSGAGKTSLVTSLSRCLGGLAVSISHTTRPPRPGEIDTQDYFFVDQECFNKMVAEDAFLEFAEVFDHSYGTSSEIVKKSLASGSDMILEIDWQGAQQVLKKLPDAVCIFILPPSLRELERRLTGRRQDSKDIIDRRMSNALSEISHYDEYEFLIVNDDFDQALEQLKSIILVSRLKRKPQSSRLESLLDDLLGIVSEKN